MKYLCGGYRISLLGVVLIAISLTSYEGASKGKPVAIRPDIMIHFHGLMVFTTQGGRISALLHSNAHGHAASMQLKSPGMTQPQNITPNLVQTTQVELVVVNHDGNVADDTAEWGAKRPYRIKNLHGSGSSELTLVQNTFGPSFTVNAGTFNGTEDVDAQFFRKSAGLGPREPVAGAVEAKITLGRGQKALLKVNGQQVGPALERPQANLAAHVIDVVNTPTYGTGCDDYHFVYYYDGFHYPAGPVPEAERYRLRKGSVSEHAPCQVTKSTDTRPCIPVEYP